MLSILPCYQLSQEKNLPCISCNKRYLWVSACVKRSKSVTFACIGCRRQASSVQWSRTIESETHSMIHALAHTQRHWNYLFFCPAGKPTYSSPWQPQEWKRCPWCLKEKWPVKSQPFSFTVCGSGLSVTLSHMDRLILPNTLLESAYAHDYSTFELVTMIIHKRVRI